MESQCEVVQLELKYCERCGGLWLRRVGVGDIFCAACAVGMPEFRMVRRTRGKAVLPAHHNGERYGQLRLVATPQRDGGRA